MMHPIRLLPLLLLAFPLGACTNQEIDNALSNIRGEPNAQQIADAKAILTEAQFSSASSAYVAQQSSSMPVVVVSSSSSSVEAVQVAVAAPPPPPCDPVVWRGTIYDCTMMHILGYVE